ncbi:MAG: P22 phage major capsid protein family protein [Dehalococcoidia bacterium]
MTNEFIKAERVVSTALGLLEREVVLPGIVWRDAGGSFRGAKNDTISIRLPAYATARTRTLRGGAPITLGERVETKVDVTLTTHIYDAVPITDEEMTLDIEDFGRQVLMPGVRAVARGAEDLIATAIGGATFPVGHQLTLDNTNPLVTITRARRLLNDASVPQGERVLLCGSAVEEQILNLDQLTKVNESGSDSALRDAVIGRIRGFLVVVSNAIAPEKAYAFHRTAFVLSLQAPAVPDGAGWGASASANGIAVRALKDYDFSNVRDRLLTDVFAGANVVLDAGEFDDDGKFIPWDGDGSEPAGILTRAVEITYDEGS